MRLGSLFLCCLLWLTTAESTASSFTRQDRFMVQWLGPRVSAKKRWVFKTPQKLSTLVPITHELSFSMAVLLDTEWSASIVRQRALGIDKILRQCGIRVSHIRLQFLKGVKDTDQHKISRSFHALRRLRYVTRSLPHPILFYVRKNSAYFFHQRQNVAFANLAHTVFPALIDTAFVPEKVLSSAYRNDTNFRTKNYLPDAHELVHILSRENGHLETAGELMSQEKNSGIIGEKTCQQMKTSVYVRPLAVVVNSGKAARHPEPQPK